MRISDWSSDVCSSDLLLDFGMRDVEIAGRRAAPQRALADRKREAVHHPHEGNDAAGLAVEADRLADAANAAPICADAAAARGAPDILVPRVDDAFEAVVHRIEVAGRSDEHTSELQSHMSIS